MRGPVRAWIYLTIVALLLIGIGHSLAGKEGTLWALMISLGVNTLFFFYGDQRLARLFPSYQVEGQDPWGLITTTQRLAARAFIPVPQIRILAISAPQAFSTGRTWSTATIWLTDGLLRSLTPQDLEALLAYHIASIKRLETFAYEIAGIMHLLLQALPWFADRLYRMVTGIRSVSPTLQSHPFTILLSPVIRGLLRFLVSSSSYFATDQLAASLLGNERQLALTLWKLDSYRATRPLTIPEPYAHLFTVSPLTENRGAPIVPLQPAATERIRRLVGHYPL